MRGLIHHLDLTVTDPEKSYPLYAAVLGALGYVLSYDTDDGYEWSLERAGIRHSVGILRARDGSVGRPHDRYAPGLHHVAWGLDSRDDVDRIYQLLQSLGADILDSPAEYPQYNDGKGYYAVFFADPDGLKLECAFTPL